MPENHFFIGIGGTGGRILCSLRKTIAQYYPGAGGEPRRRMPDGSLSAPEINTAFLYVDSSATDLNNTESWKVPGDEVSLPASSRLLIREGDLRAIITEQIYQPAIAPWVGERKLLDKLIAGDDGTEGAQQVRRLGRILFALNVSKFQEAIEAPIGAGGVFAGASTAITFHVCGTLVGGTFSGSVIDVLCQIRKRFPDAGRCKIYVYALASDKITGPTSKVWCYPNQYAALCELNALALGLYKPHDIGSVDGRRWDGVTPFSACLLASNVNRIDDILQPEQQEQIVGDWLFQRIALTAATLPPNFHQAWTLEDLIGAVADEERQRSYRFGSLGLKRWAIPEAEILGKLTYTLAHQAVLQMLFANPQTQGGYFDGESTATVPVQPLPPQLLSHDCLSLNRESTYKTYDGEWSEVVEEEGKRIIGEQKSARHAWLGALDEAARRHWEAGFRTVGATSYFSMALKRTPDRVRDTIRDIDNALFAQWLGGAVGIRHLVRALQNLSDELEAGIVKAQREKEERLRLIGGQEKRKAELESKNRRMGSLSRWWSGKKLLGKYADCLSLLYRHRTWEQAVSVEVQTLEQLKQRVLELLERMQSAEAGFLRLRDLFDREQAKRCLPAQKDFLKDVLVRELDTDAVQRFCTALIEDRTLQATHPLACRQAAAVLMGEPSLSGLTGVLGASFRRVVEDRSRQTAQDFHQRAANPTASLMPVLGVSLADRIRQRGGTDETGLKEDIGRLVRGAATAVKLDSTATPPGAILQMAQAGEMPRSRLAILLPEADSPNDAFMGRMHEWFRTAPNANHRPHVSIVPAPHTHELTLLAVDYWMAARFFEVLKPLKSHYIDSLKGTGDFRREDVVLRIHIDDQGPNLPDLFPEAGDKQKQKALDGIALGFMLGLLRERERDKRIFFEGRDAEGQPTPIVLADSRAALENGSTLLDMKSVVERVRMEVAGMGHDRQAELRNLLKERLAAETVRVKDGPAAGDTLHDEYVSWTAQRARLEKLAVDWFS